MFLQAWVNANQQGMPERQSSSRSATPSDEKASPMLIDSTGASRKDGAYQEKELREAAAAEVR